MYKFDPAGPSVEETFRAIALSQLDGALSTFRKGSGDGRSVVHEARRRCKKLRGLLRLVRPAFPQYGIENRAIRDAAALLSHLRDAEVLHQTVADLAKWRESEALGRIEVRLAADHDDERADKLGEFREQLAVVRDRVPEWSLARSGSEALLPGLRLTYRTARKQMCRARRSGLATDFHEWRKANKYHGFHIDLLKRTAPDLLVDDLRIVDELSALLGTHHDLAVLADAVAQDQGRFGDNADVVLLNQAIAARTAEIGDRAFRLGRQILAERPRAVSRRFASYWKGVS